MRSPAKSPRKEIKMPKEEELKKQDPSKIIAHIKNGKIEFVHGLITYFKLDIDVMNLKSPNDEFQFLQGQRINMEGWNPLLIAIANKQREIVRYFCDDLKVSLKNFGRRQRDSSEMTAEQKTDNDLFCLYLAVANKDQ